MDKSILSKRQQREYADALADGVPPEVIKEFDESLDRHMQKWEAKLRRALTAGATQSILTERENG